MNRRVIGSCAIVTACVTFGVWAGVGSTSSRSLLGTQSSPTSIAGPNAALAVAGGIESLNCANPGIPARSLSAASVISNASFLHDLASVGVNAEGSCPVGSVDGSKVYAAPSIDGQKICKIRVDADGSAASGCAPSSYILRHGAIGSDLPLNDTSPVHINALVPDGYSQMTVGDAVVPVDHNFAQAFAAGTTIVFSGAGREPLVTEVIVPKG